MLLAELGEDLLGPDGLDLVVVTFHLGRTTHIDCDWTRVLVT